MLKVRHLHNKGRRRMNKIILTLLTSLFVLAGCQSNDIKTSEPTHAKPQQEKTIETKSVQQAFPYPNLLAQDKQSYSMLVIGANDEQTPIEKNQKVTEHVKNILSLPTQDIAQKAYPELEIPAKVTYILFNQTGIVHQSKTIPELISFIQKNPPTN
jgi:LAS superfamily LD-carboxypeptidase LdcB